MYSIISTQYPIIDQNQLVTLRQNMFKKILVLAICFYIQMWETTSNVCNVYRIYCFFFVTIINQLFILRTFTQFKQNALNVILILIF